VPAAAAAAIAPAGPNDPRKLTGVSASPGVALGKVAQVRRTAISVAAQGAGVERERAHLDAALERARQQITAQQAANFGGQRPAFWMRTSSCSPIRELIDLAVAGLAGGRSAAYAWREAYSSYAERLEALASALLRERAGDVRDVGGRVLAAAGRRDDRATRVCSRLHPDRR